MESGYPQFMHLPLEIRLMVWKYAMPPRVVNFSPTPSYPPGPFSRKGHRQQDIPVLLHVCRESRGLAISRYGSVFTPKEEGWAWTGSQKSKLLRKIIKALRLRPRKRTIALMSPAISTYLNNPDKACLTSSKFVTYGDNFFEPIWFNPELDTLLILPNARIWGLWNTPQQINPQKVAFDVYRIYQPYGSPAGAWIRSFRPPYYDAAPRPLVREQFNHVKSIGLLVHSACEVILITLDDSQLLQPGQWSFSLDTQSQDFKDEMGVYWGSVTWRLHLAQNDALSFWEIFVNWNPDFNAWNFDRKALCEENPTVEGIWKASQKRLQPWAPPTFGGIALQRHELQLLENGDGHTYLGPVV
jgi:hypothetical protein